MKVIENLLLLGQIYLGLYSIADTLDWWSNPWTALEKSGHAIRGLVLHRTHEAAGKWWETLTRQCWRQTARTWLCFLSLLSAIRSFPCNADCSAATATAEERLRGCAERSEAVVSSQTRQCPSPAAQWRVRDRMAQMPWGVSGWLYDAPTPTWPLSPAHPKAIKAGEKTGGGIFSSCLPGAWSVCREFQSNTSKGCFFFLYSFSFFFFFPRLFLKINSNEIKIFTCWICCLLLKKALK